MPIFPGELGPLFRRYFDGRRFVVVSNREPYEHSSNGEAGELDVRRPAGGLTSALDPLLQALGGTWVAWGSGDADPRTVDAQGRVRVPPEDPRYTLRRVWLSEDDIRLYYLGYSNQFLWPLCHLRPDLTRVRARYRERYRRINQRFAEAVLDEVRGTQAAVWFQDYHLALAPRLVRARRPDLSLAHFWHIPFPPVDVFRLSANAEYLLRGMLANDLMGFHLRAFSDNFLDCVQRLTGAAVDWEARTATLDGHTCHVGEFPISIDVGQFREAATAPEVKEEMARLRRGFAPLGGAVGVGVDRLDYTKGLPEKLDALQFLWERHPAFRERFTYVQVAVPSRDDIQAYDDLSARVERRVDEINAAFGTPGWQPIHLLKESWPAERLAVLYRLADVCIVSSLQDGMNLVAKEFVASQVDRRGVLLLSEFAGAAEEMAAGATLINPYDPESCADRLRDALTLPADVRAERMERLQGSLRTIYDWMGEIFTRWGEIALRAGPERRPAEETLEELFPASPTGGRGYGAGSS